MERANRYIDQDLSFILIDLFSIITNPKFDEIAYSYACVSVQFTMNDITVSVKWYDTII